MRRLSGLKSSRPLHLRATVFLTVALVRRSKISGQLCATWGSVSAPKRKLPRQAMLQAAFFDTVITRILTASKEEAEIKVEATLCSPQLLHSLGLQIGRRVNAIVRSLLGPAWDLFSFFNLSQETPLPSPHPHKKQEVNCLLQLGTM